MIVSSITIAAQHVLLVFFGGTAAQRPPSYVRRPTQLQPIDVNFVCNRTVGVDLHRTQADYSKTVTAEVAPGYVIARPHPPSAMSAVASRSVSLLSGKQ
jgi:hypothetical protein